MGFSLTDEPKVILCPKDVREGKVSDRYLAPAISRFATSTQAKAGIGTEMDQQAKDVWRELVNLHQRWGKVSKITEGDNIRAQDCNDAKASRLFTRIVQRKNLPWGKDSTARVAYDQAHIPDCNVHSGYGRTAFPLPRANPKSGEWTRVPPSNQEVIVVAARTISQCMDV
jgi:hypothetical protein